MPLPIMPQETVRKSAKEHVYDTLRDWIVDGTLAPGEKLVDSNIASYFSVSRTPVREAILALENQKLVEILPGKATIVSYFDIKSIYSLYTAISYLHQSALEVAYPYINQEIINKLISINERYLNHTAEEKPYKIDLEFHQVFFDIADNAYFSKFKEELELHAIRVENQFFKSDNNSQKSYQDHKKIIDCLVNKDLEGAKKNIENNFMYTAYQVCDNGSELTDNKQFLPISMPSAMHLSLHHMRNPS